MLANAHLPIPSRERCNHCGMIGCTPEDGLDFESAGACIYRADIRLRWNHHSGFSPEAIEREARGPWSWLS